MTTATLTQPTAKKAKPAPVFDLIRLPTADMPGLFSVAMGDAVDFYHLEEEGHPDGRSFLVTKLTEIGTPAQEGYPLFLAFNGSDHVCHCPSGCWRPDRPCRHFSAVMSFVRNDKL